MPSFAARHLELRPYSNLAESEDASGFPIYLELKVNRGLRLNLARRRPQPVEAQASVGLGCRPRGSEAQAWMIKNTHSTV